MMRVAIAGFQHETNTFSPAATTLNDFKQADSWPKMLEGREITDQLTAMNIPMAGFIDEAKRYDWRLLPLTWCAATPSGKVSADAFEKIMSDIVAGLKHLDALDVVYLDLHGAMVSDEYPDGDGEVIRRVREAVGSNVFIACSLDLHANVTDKMIHYANLLVAYKTYPHIDMGETGQRVAQCIAQWYEKATLQKSFQTLPFLIPIVSQCTDIEPCASIYKKLEQLENEYDVALSFCPGFPLADTQDTGPTVTGFGLAQDIVDKAVSELVDLINTHKNDFHEKLLSPHDAIEYALNSNSKKSGPIIFADTQDNPGCGGSGDTIGILKCMVDAQVKGAIIGLIADGDVAALAHRHSQGEIFKATLGAKAIGSTEKPFAVECKVLQLSDGRFVGTGPYYLHSPIDLGPTALLDIEGVHVVIASKKMQAADKSIFTHLGVDVREYKIVVLKSSVHFRADFTDIAREIIIVESPGFNTADLTKINYQLCSRRAVGY